MIAAGISVLSGLGVSTVGALFSTLSAANATVIAGSRVKLAGGRRDHLTSRFERLHARFAAEVARVISHTTGASVSVRGHAPRTPGALLPRER